MAQTPQFKPAAPPVVPSVAPPVPTVAPVPAPVLPDVPPVRREFRGAWLATVANIDWPTKPGLPVAQQQAELIALLDRARVLHLNAILLQVRPACDALYASPYEPWSAYLTGTEGKAPEPFYDPLQFAVEEAHKRGLELHAWFNPFRARQTSAIGEPAETNVSKVHPERVRSYGKQLWLDPGMPEVREYVLKVVTDVVGRYDIDGVHLDDYFYPYPEKDASGARVPFPDAETYAAYQKAGGTLSVDDWRRDSVTTFIREMYTRVHAAKPWVKVGISPFGIATPGVPAQIKGFDQRAELYADAALWIRNGWGDYFSPQLYWPIEQTAQSFPVLLGSWSAMNAKNRHLWPGLYTSKYSADELSFQIKTTRGFAGSTGTVHFSLKALNADGAGSVAQALRQGVYAEPALIPESKWLEPVGSLPPAAPQNLVITPAESDYLPALVRWKPAETVLPYVWVVQTKDTNGTWHAMVIPGQEAPGMALPPHTATVCVYGVDRYGRAGIMTAGVVP